MTCFENGDLPDDLGAYLRSLIGPQLGLVFTLDLAYEEQVTGLKLLGSPNHPFRLMNLTQPEVDNLMRSVFLDRITEAAIDLVFGNSGGEPAIIHQMARRLYENNQDVMMIDMPQVQAIIPALLDDFRAEFQLIWQRLPFEARQVLIAIVSLDYQNPMSIIAANSIETWLIQTDLPLEELEIAAALRSLEYNEIITNMQGGVVAFTSRLFLRYVLQLADQETPATVITNKNVPDSPALSRSMWVAVVILAALIILALAVSGGTIGGDAPKTAVPTVTLVPDQ
jgi:hypothetical protein